MRRSAPAVLHLLLPPSLHPRVRHARHMGMVWAWDIDTAEPSFAQRYHRAALAEGLLLRPIGHTLYVMPPYVLTPDDQRCLAEGLLRVLDAVLADIDAMPTRAVPPDALAPMA